MYISKGAFTHYMLRIGKITLSEYQMAEDMGLEPTGLLHLT